MTVHTCPPPRPPGTNPGIVPPHLQCPCRSGELLVPRPVRAVRDVGQLRDELLVQLARRRHDGHRALNQLDFCMSDGATRGVLQLNLNAKGKFHD